MRRWDQWRNPWDREYAMRGRLWRGSANVEPLPQLLKPGSRVLEIGCGDGKFLHALSSAGFDFVGVDFSPRAVTLAKTAAGAGQVAVADARRLPFRAAAFPAVVARYLLGALSEQGLRLATAELLRVAAPGALVVVEEFSTSDFRFGAGRLVTRNTFERNQGITTRYFEAGELPGLLGIPGEERELRHEIRVEGKRVPRAALRFVGRKP